MPWATDPSADTTSAAADTGAWYPVLESGAGKLHTLNAADGQVDLNGFTRPDETTACLCGPVPFMRAVRGDLLKTA